VKRLTSLIGLSLPFALCTIWPAEEIALWFKQFVIANIARNMSIQVLTE
jgi:hypothetical protein